MGFNESLFQRQSSRARECGVLEQKIHLVWKLECGYNGTHCKNNSVFCSALIEHFELWADICITSKGTSRKSLNFLHPF